mgnify:CR=1 FL=1
MYHKPRKKYFKLCEEKLGLIPNVLKAYAFNEKKLKNYPNNEGVSAISHTTGCGME